MSAPEEVRLKRKRTQDPPELLLLTRSQRTDDGLPLKRIRYVRRRDDLPKAASAPQEGSVGIGAPSQQGEAVAITTASIAQEHLKTKEPVSRTFHLKRPRPADDDGLGTKRARDNTYNVPTFEEDFFRAPKASLSDNKATNSSGISSEIYRTKRPGRGSALRNGQTKALKNGSSKPAADMQALAESMHQFALDELTKLPKPTTKTRPRMSPAQSKSRHERTVASASSSPASIAAPDAMDLDDSDFVYDTYILSNSAKVEEDLKGGVGLLIIGEDDEEYWQSLLDLDEQGEEVDEDDENAEDYYAADYPEDELASDDEYDTGAYSFRPRANSDVEQWDHRDSSDDEGEAEADPFSMQSQVVKRWEQELGIAPLRSED